MVRCRTRNKAACCLAANKVSLAQRCDGKFCYHAAVPPSVWCDACRVTETELPLADSPMVRAHRTASWRSNRRTGSSSGESASTDMTAEEAAAEVVAEEDGRDKQYPSLAQSVRREYRNPRPDFPADELSRRHDIPEAKFPWYKERELVPGAHIKALAPGAERYAELGPVLEVYHREEMTSAKIATDIGEVCVNVWTPRNRNGELVGINYARVI